ncbi:MAG: MFS transporter [Planctomycetes bacterium]|nr:MFS transporter [Planctomycetota bacterium]
MTTLRHPRSIAVPDDLKPPNAHDVQDARIARFSILAACGLLFLSALPDAMVVPVLRELLVERYDVSVGAAHAFMSVNLIGALAGIGLAGFIRRRCNLVNSITIAALANASLLAMMAVPIGFVPTLVLRCIEGAADLTVYAVLFAFIAQAGPPSKRGRRMGAAATAMMLGIACGAGLGGIIGAQTAVLCLWAGALACVIVAAAAGLTLRPNRAQGNLSSRRTTTEREVDSRPIWRPLAMMFSDRFVSALLATTVPLYLASVTDMSPAAIGGLVGLAMLMTALGTWPAGRLADRVGPLRLRLIAGCIYAPGVALIPLAVSGNLAITIIDFVLIGLAGAALFASSLVAVCDSGRGAVGMGAYHAAGNAGFLVGPLAAGATLSLLGGTEPGASVYLFVFGAFALIHGAVTVTTVFVAGYRSTAQVEGQSAATAPDLAA